MKITYVVTECRDKISPECTKTFKREVKRGRPQINCAPCKAVKVPQTASTVVDPATLERECPCGNKFSVKLGRGRKASKCDDCRSNGTVYRTDEDGELQVIRAETLAEEQRELREQAGKERAARLCDLMAPLLKSTRERAVIVH